MAKVVDIKIDSKEPQVEVKTDIAKIIEIYKATSPKAQLKAKELEAKLKGK